MKKKRIYIPPKPVSQKEAIENAVKLGNEKSSKESEKILLAAIALLVLI